MPIGLGQAQVARPSRPLIRLKGKGFNFAVPLGDGPPMPTAGGPNIEELARPGRPGLTTVAGEVLKRVDIPAFWDGWSERKNVQPDVMDVVGLAEDLPLRDFTAEGPMIYSGTRFIMDWPEWVRLVKSPGGAILQAELVLKLVEFNDPGTIQPHKRGDRKIGLSPARAVGTITLDRPENLVEVAARYTNDPGEAKAIGKANGIHDLKRKLPKGTRLTIPAG